ncbi:hypothetical protein BAE44_0005024 [Dichanthelium oligosanthes]|uniref:Bifunctional inhibitor/plant lipid transfer protein/seed storage helical domain-containing protein n=1 Tax=Dichanthelium oligosanthes TaxID=888268 RepID=A0A1E5W981_9POAL|nr:hypothetical protein BAE44_0005024 [Dichanthelium oligosanthes]
MSLKVAFQLLAFAMIFTMFTPHQVWGEKECYREKELFKIKCMETTIISGPYVHPSQSCVNAVKKYDMVCICSIPAPEEEAEISVMKTLQLARECHKPIPVRSKCGSKYITLFNSKFRKGLCYIEVNYKYNMLYFLSLYSQTTAPTIDVLAQVHP